MKKVSKPKLGQWRNNRMLFSDDEKRIIIEDYLSGDETKSAVYKRYTGYSSEHGKITMWMRKLGIKDRFEKTTNLDAMSNTSKKKVVEVEDFEKLQLKKRIEDLEKQLYISEMKAIAFSTMVDIAEQEFKIPIRKKYNTKPLK